MRKVWDEVLQSDEAEHRRLKMMVGPVWMFPSQTEPHPVAAALSSAGNVSFD